MIPSTNTTNDDPPVNSNPQSFNELVPPAPRIMNKIIPTQAMIAPNPITMYAMIAPGVSYESPATYADDLALLLSTWLYQQSATKGKVNSATRLANSERCTKWNKADGVMFVSAVETTLFFN